MVRDCLGLQVEPRTAQGRLPDETEIDVQINAKIDIEQILKTDTKNIQNDANTEPQ